MSDNSMDVFFLNEQELMEQIEGESTKTQETNFAATVPSEELAPFESPPLAPIRQEEEKTFDDDVYKKWFRTKTKSGFLTLRTWLEAGKASIDIGEIANGTSENTIVWCDAVELATYLQAVTNGQGASLYPVRYGLNEPEGFIHYGGSNSGNQPISRILKVSYWRTGSGDQANVDSSAFAWKCGHFKARTSDTGAFIPDMKSPLSVNQIKIARSEMAVMSYRLNLALQRFAGTYDGDLFRALNGNNR